MVKKRWTIEDWRKLVADVQKKGCITIKIGDLKQSCDSDTIRGARGKFPAGKMGKWLKREKIAFGNDVAGNARRDHLVLLYDAGEDNQIAKLFRIVEAVRKQNVPQNCVREYARQLSAACLLMAHS